MKKLMWIFLSVFILAQSCADKTDEQKIEKEAVRFGSVIKVKPEKLDEYKALHADPWPGVNQMIKNCNISSFSIYYRDGYLFSYMEYTGENFEADMKKMAADSLTQEWWKLTDPCQEPVESAGEGVWWASMEEVYHLD
jgi:L-rhamnose mutarotase